MRQNCRDFIRIVAREINLPEPVYEFGSRQVAGQAEFIDLRSFFRKKEYVGCDFIDGPGVDRIEQLTDLSMASESVGTCILVDTLEHVAHPFKAMSEVYRVLKPGGVVILTVPFAFPIHAFPHDYFRYTPEGVRELLRKFGSGIIGRHGHPENPHTVYAIAARGENQRFHSLLLELTYQNGEIKLYQPGRFGTMVSRFYFLKASFRRIVNDWMSYDETDFKFYL